MHNHKQGASEMDCLKWYINLYSNWKISEAFCNDPVSPGPVFYRFSLTKGPQI